jgi:pilus assembly protein Flp/PilA
MSGSRLFKNFSTRSAEIPARPAWVQSQVGDDLHVPDGRPKMARFVKLLKNIEGATAIEYGLIAALIAVAAIGAMQGIGNKLNTTFNNVSNSLN